MATDKRVDFDFEVDFANGGGIQGQEFRLDINGDEIDDSELADYIVRDLRLLMVERVRILRKQIIHEQHKRGHHRPVEAASRRRIMIDLSHEIYDGLVSVRGLPAPRIDAFLTRSASTAHYAAGTSFHIGQVEMVANTGTYMDSPFHRYDAGTDLPDVSLAKLADLEGLVVRVAGSHKRAIDRGVFVGSDVRGKAVLVDTGWAMHWQTPQYLDGYPFLTRSAAEYLRDEGAALVGIDSPNIDDDADMSRPCHSILLGADVLIVEHLCRLGTLPIQGFSFTAVPAPIRGLGTFPVRAFATLSEAIH